MTPPPSRELGQWLGTILVVCVGLVLILAALWVASWLVNDIARAWGECG